MAGKKKTDGTEEKQAAPTFVLRADTPGHLRALMVAAEVLPDNQVGEALGKLREFELWEEANR